MTVLYVPGTPGETIYAGRASPSVGGLITTLSLVNTSGSTQAANFVSPMLGMPFVQGDLPTGEYPVFTLEDDTPCPATIYNDVAWGDGSKKFCGVLLRSPASIAGSGTQTINVNSAGSAPAASSRSLSDFAAADIKIELTGVTNLSGVWTASLNTAITDATEIVVIGDGPAGKVWRIRGPFKQSGSAHGQLECYHYVAALQDNAGGLLGIRYMGRICQPWTDVTSPAVALRTFTAVLKSGATTLRTLQGVQNSGGTLGANINLPHYASVYTCGASGTWDFIQGGGSASADCTVRVVQDKTYMVKSRMVPPYDTSLSITAETSIDYNPMTPAGMTLAMGTTGERGDIGVFPTQFARHIISPTANTERQVRVRGLASGSWRTGLRISTTGQPVPFHDVATYAGMGTPRPTYRYWSTEAVGVNAIPTGFLFDEEVDAHHRPQGSYFPYLLTAEPQYLDQLVEQANTFLGIIPPGAGATWKTTTPITGDTKTGAFHSRDNVIGGTTYKCSGVLFRQDLLRYAAWMLRDLGEAAGIYPDTCPQSTGVKAYFNAALDGNFDGLSDYLSFMTSTFQDSGLLSFFGIDKPVDNPWCTGYLTNSVAHVYSITGKANALATATHLAKYWAGINSRMDIGCPASLNMITYDSGTTRLDSLDDVSFQIQENCTFTFDATTNFVSKAGNNAVFDFTNGDFFTSYLGWTTYIAEAIPRRKLYVVNSTGATCQFSLTPGGAPLDIIANGTSDNVYAQIDNYRPGYSFERFNGPETYMTNIRGAMRHLEAIGITAVNAARVSADTRLVADGAVSFADIPKNAFLPAYPA